MIHFNTYEYNGSTIVVADSEKKLRRFFLIDELLKIPKKEYESAVKEFNGEDYAIGIGNIPKFKRVEDAQQFIENFLEPEIVAAKLRGVIK